VVRLQAHDREDCDREDCDGEDCDGTDGTDDSESTTLTNGGTRIGRDASNGAEHSGPARGREHGHRAWPKRRGPSTGTENAGQGVTFVTVAGEGQVPVGKLLGRQPQKPRRSINWRAVVRWRDWRLPVKLSAVTLVPIIIAIVLGVTTIANQVGRSDSYQRIDRLVALSSDIRILTDGLERERTQTAAVLSVGTVGGSPELTATRSAVDGAVKPFTDALGRGTQLDAGVATSSKEATDQVARLGSIRQQAGAGKLDPAQAIAEYSTITSALLKLETALAAGVSDNAIGGTPGALHDLQVAKEELSLSQALVDYGIVRGTLAPSALDQVRTAQVRMSDRLDDFRAKATPSQRQDFDGTVGGSAFDTRDSLANTVLGEQGAPSAQAFRQLSAKQWDDSSSAVIGQINVVSQRLGDQIATTSANLVDSSSSGAGLFAVLLFGALVLAAAVVFLITRQLLRSLRVLRNSALDVAEKQLPAAVRNIQEGRAHDTDVQPVPVNVNDEIGEVARAFDAVHHQALRLATEQAAMRTGYGSVFVNLSRRSQSLVQRQLQLIERLERDEEDADQLATLFQLDHLATRMRRNNENLMVLSGSEPTRRGGQPVTTTDVLRAAVSEIEQYQRVVVQPPPTAKIVGYAASDLMRLIAELLDNATAFSAPETRVTVATRITENGFLSVDILDKGIGMNEAEVAEANIRLTEAVSVDLATSRRMGLFVVGRLASRHRIGVTLHGGKDIVGVRATVTVPAELVMTPTGLEGTGPIPAHQWPPSPASGGALPRRQRPVNGASHPAVTQGMPAQGFAAQGWPTADAPAANGHAVGQVARPPSDLEVSGTALFSPISKDDARAPAEPKPPVAPEPAPQTAAPEVSAATADESALPSGKDLFVANGTVLSDWWEQAASSGQLTTPPPPAPASTSETTPIFDEMLSAWFRTTAPAPSKPSSEPRPRSNWDFASDENWRTVQAVSQAPPSSFTQAGLPMRRRGEQLMPGSAAPAAAGAAPDAAAGRPELPVRDPAEVRGRLSSFQQGVSRGRQAHRHEARTPEAETPTTEALKRQPSKLESPMSQSPITEAPVTGVPKAETPQAETPQAETLQAGDPQAIGAAPIAMPVQPETAKPQPEKPVLPRRTAKPVPPPPTSASGPVAASTPAATPAPASGGAPHAGETADWTFDSDDSWKAVQAVTRAAPSTFTPAGLPRRRRGEQLLPGSAVPPASAAGPRTERDAHDVRGRLSSFQQGIRRGRHRTAQSAEGNEETLEGE
jgi:signal transduction histidine kinase